MGANTTLHKTQLRWPDPTCFVHDLRKLIVAVKRIKEATCERG